MARRKARKPVDGASFDIQLFGIYGVPTPAGTPQSYHLAAQCESVRVYHDTERGGYVAYAGNEPSIDCPPGGFIGCFDELPPKRVIEAFAWAYETGRAEEADARQQREIV